MSEKVKPMETKRLILREIKEEDTLTIVKWRSNPKIYRYFFSSKPITEEEHRNWYFNNYVEDKSRIEFMVIEKASKKKIGVFNIKRNVDDVKCGEIGYLLDVNAQGKGYALEGIKKLMFFARYSWGCKEIVFIIHEENIASRALADKLGCKKKFKEGKFIWYYIFLSQKD